MSANSEPTLRHLAPTEATTCSSMSAWLVAGSLAIREDGAVEHDWTRLANAVRTRRASLRMSQRELATSAGVAATTIRNIEGGRTFKRVPDSLTAIEKALGWSFGSADTVLGGGEPTLVSESSSANEVPDPTVQPLASHGDASGTTGNSGIPIGVQAALEDGTTVATDVIEFPDLRLIVVVKAGSYTTEDERQDLRESMREWIRLQREIRGLLPKPDEASDSAP